MRNFQEIMLDFVNLESADQIFPLSTSSQLCEGIVAWQTTPITFKPNIISSSGGNCVMCESDDASVKWEFLWNCIDFDMQYFIKNSGISSQQIQAVFDRLKGLRLIYPDGSIHRTAKQYLQVRMFSQLKKR